MLGFMVGAAMNGYRKLRVDAISDPITQASFEDTAYAGVEFQSDGEQYKTPITGPNSTYSTDQGDWLTHGDASDVWVTCTITGGTLGSFNSEDAGQGTRLQLNTSRAWRIVKSSPGTDTIIATFDFHDASSGGNLLDSISITFTATHDT